MFLVPEKVFSQFSCQKCFFFVLFVRYFIRKCEILLEINKSIYIKDVSLSRYFYDHTDFAGI